MPVVGAGREAHALDQPPAEDLSGAMNMSVRPLTHCIMDTRASTRNRHFADSVARDLYRKVLSEPLP